MELHHKSWLYSSNWPQPCQVTVPTRCTNASRMARRFAVPESLLQDFCLQPYVHNSTVSVVEGRHTYQFCMFFKHHCCLHQNLLFSGGDSGFHGDAVVMRIGVGPLWAVVNMWSLDAAITDYMIKWWVHCSDMMLFPTEVTYSFSWRVGEMAGTRPPCSLTFVKLVSLRVSSYVQECLQRRIWWTLWNMEKYNNLSWMSTLLAVWLSERDRKWQPSELLDNIAIPKGIQQSHAQTAFFWGYFVIPYDATNRQYTMILDTNIPGDDITYICRNYKVVSRSQGKYYIQTSSPCPWPSLSPAFLHSLMYTSVAS